MITFDRILPIATQFLDDNRDKLEALSWLLINRDLKGRIRFVVPSETNEEQRAQVEALYRLLAERIMPYAYPAESGILYEAGWEELCRDALHYHLKGYDKVWVVDRLATDGSWAPIITGTTGASRIVFFSIKGGVGRSSALAATAWTLAQTGKRVLVIDLDLESPGLSSSLLQPERQPTYGISDWLVEDLVENADTVFEGMIATSDLSHDGEIFVVPAHGADPGEYIAKLGRIWMPKVHGDGSREPWSARLRNVLRKLEEHIKPEVVLIDARAGIDEVASSCVTGIGANLVLLFALEGNQTWNGYSILFNHWQRVQVAPEIRERLQVVAALVPELEPTTYLKNLREHAHKVFTDLYDDIEPPATEPAKDSEGKWRVSQLVEGWNFDEADESAPHNPWPVNWHRSFAGIQSLQGRLAVITPGEVRNIFGPLLDGITAFLPEKVRHE